jgi:hypothetical protein
VNLLSGQRGILNIAQPSQAVTGIGFAFYQVIYSIMLVVMFLLEMSCSEDSVYAIPLSTKVGTKFRRQVAVDQSV